MDNTDNIDIDVDVDMGSRWKAWLPGPSNDFSFWVCCGCWVRLETQIYI